MKNKYYYKDGTTLDYRDYNKIRHNCDGPAIEGYYNNGQLEYRAYYIDGKKHNTKQPAVEWYHKNGKLEYKAYYIEDKYHNIKGPAIERYDDNGKLNYKAYYIDGKGYTEEEYNKTIKEVKQLPLPEIILDNREWVKQLYKDRLDEVI